MESLNSSLAEVANPPVRHHTGNENRLLDFGPNSVEISLRNTVEPAWQDLPSRKGTCSRVAAIQRGRGIHLGARSKCTYPWPMHRLQTLDFPGARSCSFSRMRSEGFSFNSGGLGVESCSRSVVSMFATVRNRSQPSATVRNRSQPSATVRSRTLRRCHWGKLLQVTFHGCVTCQFATLFHCDLHENDMSRKKRDAFRCTGAVV